MRRLAPALAAAVCLVAPAAASAQSLVGGSPLANPADYPSDCRQQLIAVGFDAYSVYSDQQPSCTWWQTGVFGSIDPGDRFKGYVPGNGTITSVSVRSGPNPAPLRFVVARQLTPILFGRPDPDNQGCCFFVREAGPFQPAANTVSTFSVNLPVESNRTPTEITNDIIGFSAASGTGTLPLHVVPGRFTPSAFLVNGTPDAAAVWPALGAIPNDSGGGRRPTGIAGIEVLLQYTMCTGAAGARAAQTCGGGGGGGGGGQTPPPGAPASIPTSKLKAANGRVGLKVSCAAAAGCKGSVALKTTGRKSKSLGSKRVNIASGRTATVRVKLNKLGRKLAKRKRVKVVATVDLGAAGTITKQLTLKRPKKP
jgi:hypothetical protein